MRILAITAGAGSMYCGSCFRDNALAAELMAQGHHVVLAPIYTPTVTDEANVSQEKIFFGGIGVYLQQYMPLFRKTPWLLDRIWDSRLALKLAAKKSIPVNPKLLGELTVSMLEGEDGYQSKELEKMIHWLRNEPPFDVISLPYTLLIGLARSLKKALDCPICCTLQGEDLFLEGLQEPYRTQSLELIRANIRHVDRFLAVSEYYAGFMSRYLRIPESKLFVTPLGINLQGYAPVSRSRGGIFTIGYFARVCPEKGLHNLCAAYRLLRKEKGLTNARLEVAGYLAPENRDYLAGLEREMRDCGLGGEFRYRGAIDRAEKIQFLQTLDVLSVPSTYNEPKGIYLLEAMANGVPVVQPRRGAFPEILAKTGGGLIVDADSTDGLAEGILSLWRDPALAAELGRKGAERVRQHFNVGVMAECTLQAYAGLGERRVVQSKPS
ncbi:MAG: glycosyltransferase family 4 protein [Bryobacteraceae bacterium]